MYWGTVHLLGTYLDHFCITQCTVLHTAGLLSLEVIEGIYGVLIWLVLLNGCSQAWQMKIS